MTTGYEDMQKLLKDNMDSSIKSVGAISKGFQAIAAEATDYSKKSVEDFSKLFEKLIGAKSLDTVVEIQSDYFKKSYEDAVGQVTKITEMYVELGKEVAKPYESFASKFGK